MPRLILLFRLIVRPMLRDRVRALLTVSAVALGVAVIVAVDLAGEAAMGSFRSSLESLQGSAAYEITQIGGIPESALEALVRLEEPLVFSPRVEGFALLTETGEKVPVFGVDLVGDPTLGEMGSMPRPGLSELADPASVWVSESLGLAPGAPLSLIVGDRALALEVRGVLGTPDDLAGRFVFMDIALAQRVLGRAGRLDRIYVHTLGYTPIHTSAYTPIEERDRTTRLASVLPSTASIRPAGSRTEDSRRMLEAFRFNLRMLSYATILVGVFLIYNTITAYIVRRRRQIGIVRAIGASRARVRMAFLLEGAVFGVLGAATGLALGRLLAVAAVDALGGTVNALYVSSIPGEFALRPETAALGGLTGVGISILSAWWPAREAAGVAPTEAMAVARLDYEARTGSLRSSALAAGFAVLAGVACLAPPVGRVPAGGYLSLLLSSLAVAGVAAGFSGVFLRAAGRWLTTQFGIVAGVAARGLAASLGRTSVIVAAMAVALALVVSMAVTVGSFREAVVDWLGDRLRADLYVSPAGPGGRDAASTMRAEVARRAESVPGVMEVGRFRSYSIRYGDVPVTLGLADTALYRRHSGIRFVEGADPATIWPRLAAGGSVIASELFGYHHDIRPGDTLRLPLGSAVAELEVVGIFYDYSGARGLLIGDRDALLEYLPDPRLSSLAVHLEPDADLEETRARLARAVSGLGGVVATTRSIRERAIEIFDRTFLVTWALGAIALFVAVLGMAEALMNLVFDRRTELAFLRMLGASARQIRRLVLLQSGLLGALASLMGFGLGAVWSQVLLRVIHKQSFGWGLPLHWPWSFLATALGIMLVASVGAGLYPARMAARLAPIEVLRAD